MLLHAVVIAAARYGRHARPLLSCSADFYIRLFVLVSNSAFSAKFVASKTGTVHQCGQCDSFFIQPSQRAITNSKGNTKFTSTHVIAPQQCAECGGHTVLGGPIHIGPLHDMDFVEYCSDVCNREDTLPHLTCRKKLDGLLRAMSTECNDCVLYYSCTRLVKSLRLTQISVRKFRGTLRSLGYRASHFHRDPDAIKTDAPNEVVFDLLRAWAKEHPPQKSGVAAKLLEKEIHLPLPIEWVTEEDGQHGMFLSTPTESQGPMHRAKAHRVESPKQTEELTSDRNEEKQQNEVLS